MHHISILPPRRNSILINDASRGDTDAKVTGTISHGLNTISSMEFTIYRTNPGYNHIDPFMTKVQSVNVDGDLEFFGRIIKATPVLNQDGSVYKNVVCEGCLGFLHDSSPDIAQYKGNVKTVIDRLFYQHSRLNSGVEYYLRDTNISEEIDMTAEGETTYEFLTKIAEEQNAEIVIYGIEKIDGAVKNSYQVQIGLVVGESNISSGEIRLGNNLISYSCDVDTTDLCTELTPYGAKIYTDEDNLERVTIASVNNGMETLFGSTEYGYIHRNVIFQDIEEPEELLKEAESYLKEHEKPKATYQITAFDEHILHTSVPKITIGSCVYVTAPVLGISGVLLKVTQKSMCIENPANDTFTVGTTVTGTGESSRSVSAGDLNRVYDQINTNDTVNAYQINAVRASINELVANDLTAVNAAIGNLKADNARITTLIFGTADGQHISVEFSDAVVGQISNGIITNAMIKSLAADKLTAGRISTNLIDIASDDGMFVIKDNTLQCYDGEQIRVQIGKDANGDYNLILCDADGNVLWDAKGLGEAGIRSGLIVDRMVAADAAIQGGKIDLPSLIREINNGKEVIKSSAIVYDKDGQSLTVAFNKMESKLLEGKGYNLYPDSERMEEHWVYSGMWDWSECENFRVGTSSDYGYVDSTVALTEGVTYTLSANVKGRVMAYYPNLLEIAEEFPDAEEWQRVNFTFTYSPKRGKPVFTSPESFSICGVKCEYGGLGTEWCKTAGEENTESLLQISTVEITNENMSFDLYRRDGLVEQMASLAISAEKIRSSVIEIEESYATKTELEQTASRFVIWVEEDGSVKSGMTLAKNGIEFIGGKATFSGRLMAASGSFSGSVTAAKGEIGGWEITEFGLYNTEGRYLTSVATTSFMDAFGKAAQFQTTLSNGILHSGSYKGDPQSEPDMSNGVTIFNKGIKVSSEVTKGRNPVQSLFEVRTQEGDVVIGNNIFIKTYLNKAVEDGADIQMPLLGLTVNDNIWIGGFSGGECPNDAYVVAENVYKKGTGGNVSLSDARHKKDVADIEHAVEFIRALQPKKYKFKEGTSGRKHFGFLAQEVEQIMKETVGDVGVFLRYQFGEGTVDPDDETTYTCGLRYEEFIAPMVSCIQDLYCRLEEQNAEIEEWKNSKIHRLQFRMACYFTKKGKEFKAWLERWF